MTSTPAEELAETLVELAGALSGEFDLDAFLRLLVNRCARVLEVDAVCLFLNDLGAAASHPAAEPLASSAEGPGVDCGRLGEVVAVIDIAEPTAARRWPSYAATAHAAGYVAAHAVPLRRDGEVVGALTLLCTRAGTVATADVRVAQAIADLSAIGLLQARALRRQADLAVQLQHALNSRVIIEQAKGVLAERLGLTMTAAFTALRSYARSNNAKVAELALSIVDGKFDTDRLRR